MPFYGSIVVQKRSGADGSTFPLINEVMNITLHFYKNCPVNFHYLQECLLGRAEECDIRIWLPIVSKEHAKLKVQVTDGAVSFQVILGGFFQLFILGQHHSSE